MPPTRDDVISVARESDAFLEDMRRLHRTRIRNAIKKGQKKLIAAVRKLDTDSSGNLVSTRVNIKLAEKVQRDAIGFFAEEYGVTVADLVDDFDEIADFIQRSWGDLDEAVSFTGIDKDIIDTLKDNALADYEQFGLQAQRRLANEMYGQVVGGGSFDTLLTTVTGIFEGHVDARGVPMAVHAQTHAFDSIMNFHNQVNLKKAEDLDIGDYLYVGDIIKTSRRFCKVRAGKVYSRAQIESWNRLDWDGKRGPAFENRGGWNCRHHWRPVRKEWLDGDVEVKEFVAPKEPPAKKARVKKASTPTRSRVVPTAPPKKAPTKRKAAPTKAKRTAGFKPVAAPTAADARALEAREAAERVKVVRAKDIEEGRALGLTKVEAEGRADDLVSKREFRKKRTVERAVKARADAEAELLRRETFGKSLAEIEEERRATSPLRPPSTGPVSAARRAAAEEEFATIRSSAAERLPPVDAPPSSAIPKLDPDYVARVEAEQGWRVSNWASVRNMSEEDYIEQATAHLTKRVNKADVWTRTHESTLEKVLDSGRFKSQFETQRSGGLLSNATRETFEREFFGYSLDTPAAQRPIYGYLSDLDNGGLRMGRMDQYGDVAVRFKKSVRARSTFNVGDSIDGTSSAASANKVPQPVTRPTYKAAHYDPDISQDLLFEGRAGDAFKIDGMHDHPWSYIEAQIHGQAPIEDIAEVLFRVDPPSALLQELLEENNIPWRIIKVEL